MGKMERRLQTLWYRHGTIAKHIGLLIIVVLYLLLGTAAFVFIEGSYEEQQAEVIADMMEDVLNETKEDMLNSNISVIRTVAEREDFDAILKNRLESFGDQLYELYEYRHAKGVVTWDMYSSAFYCFTVMTTIGYGNIAPATPAGRALSIVYAIFGIPLLLLLLSVIGQNLARPFRVLCRKLKCGKSKCCTQQVFAVDDMHSSGLFIIKRTAIDNRDTDGVTTGDELFSTFRRKVYRNSATQTDASTECDHANESIIAILTIVFIIIYISFGAVGYAYSQEWTLLDGFYFVFVSLSTIGFGDMLPEFHATNRGRVVGPLTSVYLLIGMAVLATGFTLVQDQVGAVFRKIKNKVCEFDGN
ncbi:TWiK family of potassium channels protein 18-like [Saccoglossus kowalevskii]|uniref:Potassium channel subfamily K member 4-like n=1 Tax=Saccoglossus kowalevskii TaxID=10224 RepID=A0ABM0MRH3_SACKO|nr:PREDICTED: potassium channel subfamily K member 4-like [Saccoglossus kowalevskii]